MKKDVVVLLALSLVYSTLATVVISEQADEIKRHKEHKRKMDAWAKTMNAMLADHYKHGGTIRSSQKVYDDVEAYIIFASNDLL
jgi:hypothetical protein